MFAYIPELGEAVSAVNDCGRTAISFLPANTSGDRSAVGKSVLRAMTSAAGHSAIGGETRIEVQVTAEFGFFRSVRIVFGPHDRHQAQRLPGFMRGLGRLRGGKQSWSGQRQKNG